MVFLLCVTGCFSACRNTSKEQELIEVKELIDSAERQHNANNILASFEILSKAREKAHKNKFTEEYIVCLNMLSRLYAYIDDFEEAAQLNEEAYAVAADKNDSLTMMKALNNKGVIMSMAGRQQEALEIFQNLLQLALKLKDPDMTAIASRNIAGMEINLGNSAHALTLIDSALQGAAHSKGEEYYWELQNMRAGIIKGMGDSEKAAVIYDSLLSSISNGSSLRTEILRKKALLDAENGDRVRALNNLNDANVTNDHISRYFLYLDYSKVNEMTGALHEALDYKDSALSMMDSVHLFSQRSFHRNSNLKFNLLKKEEESRVAALKTKIYLIIAFLLIIALLLGYLYVNKKRKFEKLSSEMELMKMQEELKKTQQEHSELQTKVDEYLEKLKYHELSIASRDHLMKEVTEYLQTKGDTTSNKIFLTKLRSISADTDNLDSFLNHTRESRPELFVTLIERHPTLNQNDLRYLSLVYLQLSANEIATLLNISLVASKKRKQRICAKMGIESTTDLYSYLLSI
ncbi:MAG: hypothetical protein HDR88_05205 [Bacteroides sp.]|nr:hypothetical protein [Bacteroides sp.]